MRGSRAATREKILTAAYGLFYRKGFHRVGVDEIATAAGLSKRTLYDHLRSKDDLLAAVMQRQGDLAMARLRVWGAAPGSDAAGLVQQLFDGLARWSSQPGWEGPGFTRLAMELADLPGHPARLLARRHKAAVEAWLAEALAARGLHDVAVKARQLQLLLEGCMLLLLVQGERGYLEAAKAAALRLLADPLPDRIGT